MFFRQLRNELWKLFGKKRTYIGFGAFLFAQIGMLVLFHYSKWQKGAAMMLEGNGYIAEQFISALTVSVIMLIPQLLILMPLYTCLVGGDMVAKEVEDGTMRMILCRPITRLRLLVVKWVAGAIFCIALEFALGAMALLFARIWFPWSGMFVSTMTTLHPIKMFTVLPPGEGLLYYGIGHGYLALNAMTMFSLAFMFSCFNMKPAAATILGLTYLLANFVLQLLPIFEDYRDYCITTHFQSWLLVFGRPIQWPELMKSLCVIAGFNFTTFVAGVCAFHVRDIKS